MSEGARVARGGPRLHGASPANPANIRLDGRIGDTAIPEKKTGGTRPPAQCSDSVATFFSRNTEQTPRDTI